MLALEDLADLGETLRDEDFRIATGQHLAAQLLLLRLAGLGALPARRRELSSYLGPIFCSSALEQARFESVYAEWVSRRFREKPPPAPPHPHPLVPPLHGGGGCRSWRWGS